MSAVISDTLTVTQLQRLALDFEDAQAKLMGAQYEVSLTGEQVAGCKYQLDNARACAIAQGVDGKNEAQRDASLRLSLSELHDDLHRLELKLSTARLELSFAQLEWDTLHYRLRAYETIAALKGGRA